MGARGPKPKPTALRIAQGNPGRKKINKTEPKPAPAIPYCPNHLTGRAKQEWRRIAPILKSLGLLTELDRAALAAYCQAYATWAKAIRLIKNRGELIKTSKGYLQDNPWNWIANRSLKQMESFFSEFGLSPAARTRIEIDKDLLKWLYKKPPKTIADQIESTVDDLLNDMDGKKLPGEIRGQA